MTAFFAFVALITQLILSFSSGKFHFRVIIGEKKTNGDQQSEVFIVKQRAIKGCFDQHQRLVHVGGSAKSQAEVSRDIPVSHGMESAESTCFLSV